MTADDWSSSLRIEETYRSTLQRLMDRFLSFLPADLVDPFDILTALQDFVTTDTFRETAYAAASRMVTSLRVESARTWREAASESSRGRMIYEALQREMQGPTGARMLQIVNENARLISTFPLDISAQVANFIKTEAQKGRRASDIADDLKEQFPGVSRGRINLIARTETSKASTALTRTRAEYLNLPWYQWVTSKDARVRLSHRRMDGTIIAWAEPASPEALVGEKRAPAPYAPGDIYNCRCYAKPLMNLDRISWPALVYVGGQIQMMTRFEFERIAAVEVRRAA